jgi:phospholipid/cholesterol/gamma-HCH transport system permease protein
MITAIQKLGSTGLRFCEHLGTSGLFLLRVLVRRGDLRKELPLLIEQIYFVGVLSVIIIIVSGLFIGMVVALQGYTTLQRFGAQAELGQLVALSVVRELGPVVSALLFIGRACSALTAEIGLMQATEQLASMEMMAIDPLGRIIFPRLWAGFIVMPILMVIFNVVAIYGAYLLGVLWLGIDSGTFWSNMQASVSFRLDIVNGIIKSVVFGFVATWIAVYQGYYAVPTAEGISRAATRTVVYASVVILGLDFVLTAMMMEAW